MTEGNVIKVTSQVEGEDNALNYKYVEDEKLIEDKKSKKKK